MKKYRLCSYRMQNDKILKCLNYYDYDFNLLNREYELLNYITLEIRGSNYNSKQDFLRNLAIDIQDFYSNECDVDLSILEMSEVSQWLEIAADRFGLLKEFRENWIC